MALQLKSSGLMPGKSTLAASISATPDYGAVSVTLPAVPPNEKWAAMWKPCRAADVLATPELLLPLTALQNSEDSADHVRIIAAVDDQLHSEGRGLPIQVRNASHTGAKDTRLPCVNCTAMLAIVKAA